MRRLLPELTIPRALFVMLFVTAVIVLALFALPVMVDETWLSIAVFLGSFFTLAFWMYYARARSTSVPRRGHEGVSRVEQEEEEQTMQP